jgi:hypothetical protein
MADLKKLDKVVDQLEIQSQKLMKFSEIYAEIDKIKADLESNINSFEEKSQKLDTASDSLNKETKKLTAKLTEIQSGIMHRIDLIEDAHKKFQRDLDSDLSSKLTKHKSDIKVTVREEGKATAETIENKLNTTFLKELNNINKRTGFLIMFGVAIVGLNVYLIQSLIN